MLNKLKQLTFQQKALVVLGIILLFLAYNISILASRTGEVKVSIEVIPKDARISIDDKPSSGSSVYLGSGKHTFSASAEGWSTAVEAVDISQEQARVILLPEPESEEVKNWLKNNLDVQLEREKLGGERFAIKGQESVRKNPLIESLPISGSVPPYTIDFGPSKQREGDIFLIISKSSPNGRLEALKWIRQNGEDPTDYEIIFSDFINPLANNREHAD